MATMRARSSCSNVGTPPPEQLDVWECIEIAEHEEKGSKAMPKIIVTVDCADDSDFDWLKGRVESAVEEVVADQREAGKLDGEVDVSMEVDFGD